MKAMKKKCRQILKSRSGSTLQVVLVIFLVLMISLLSYGVYMKNACELYRYELLMNQQREIEILFKNYCRKTEDEDLLLSGTLRGEEGKVHYTIDDMGSYFIIKGDIALDDIHYAIYMEMNTDDLKIRTFKYL